MTKWTSKKLEDCIEKIKQPEKIPSKSFLSDGLIPVISQEKDFINGYWDNHKDAFKVSKPVVIFGDHTRIIKYVDFDFVFGADGVKILQPRDFLNPKYFYYYLLAHPVKHLGYARHFRLLKEMDVLYPSLSDQNLIVKLLDQNISDVDVAISKTEHKVDILNKLKQSLLRQAFAGELK